MESLNYAFFESFKKLDGLCRDCRGGENGVTGYINEMRETLWNNYRHVPNWNTDLEQLIRLRHIRNQLAHTEGAFYEIDCTQQDIDWIRAFHKRIMNQTDPLAVLHRNLALKAQTSKPIRTNTLRQNGQLETKNYIQRDYTYNQSNKRHRRGDKASALIGCLLFVLLILAFILFFF